MDNMWHAPLDLSSIFLQKSLAQKFHLIPERKVEELVPTAMLRLPQKLAICMETMSIDGKNVHELP